MARRPNAERHSGMNRPSPSPRAARSSLADKCHLTAFTFDPIHRRPEGKRAGRRSASRRSRFRSLAFLIWVATSTSHLVSATQRWDPEIRCLHRAHFSAIMFSETRERRSRRGCHVHRQPDAGSCLPSLIFKRPIFLRCAAGAELSRTRTTS